MRKDYTYIACLIDRSGSMSSIRTDAEGGFNSFIKEQKKVPGKCSVFLAQFDDQYDVVWDGVDIKRAKAYSLMPRGSTALYDSAAKAIQQVGERLSAMDEADRPDKVIFMIITDGQENASKEIRAETLKGIIEHQTAKYNWQFMYLGANQDAILSAKDIAITCALNYGHTGTGTRSAYLCASNNILRYRKGNAHGLSMFDVTDAEEQAKIDSQADKNQSS